MYTTLLIRKYYIIKFGICKFTIKITTPQIINACLQNPGKMKCILTFYQMPVEQNTRTDCLDV